MIAEQASRLAKLRAELDREGQTRLDTLSEEQRGSLSRELIANDELREKSEAMIATMSALSAREFARRLIQHFEQPHSTTGVVGAPPSNEDTAMQTTKCVEAAFEAIRLGIALDDEEALHALLERRGLFDWEWLAHGPAAGGPQ